MSTCFLFSDSILFQHFPGYGTEVSNTFLSLVNKIELYKETNQILNGEIDLKIQENHSLQGKYDEVTYVMQALQQEVRLKKLKKKSTKNFYFIILCFVVIDSLNLSL